MSDTAIRWLSRQYVGEQQRPHVYMLTRHASHYYQTMTKHDRAPVLVEQEI